MARPKPADERVPYTLRLPRELHQRLVDASGFSMNAEIVSRLEASFWREEAAAVFPPARRLHVTLEGKDIPLSLKQVHSYVEEIVAALPEPPDHVSVEYISKETARARAESHDAAMGAVEAHQRIMGELLDQQVATIARQMEAKYSGKPAPSEMNRDEYLPPITVGKERPALDKPKRRGRNIKV